MSNAKLCAYKITVSDWDSETVDQFVENQTACTIERAVLQGDILYLFPYFEDIYSEDTLADLQNQADSFFCF